MANRELVVAIFADAGPYEKGVLEAMKANKVFSLDVEKMAQKNIAATLKQQESLRALRAEYMKVAATAEEGSSLQIAAATRLAAANKKLGIETMTAGRAFDTFTRKAASLGRTMTMSVTAPIAIAGAVATKMFIDFQRNMEMIHTQAGASQREVNKLSPQVLNYATQAGGSPVGPNDLAKGLYHIESLGLRGSKAMDALKVSSQAAGLGIAGIEEVATALGGAVVTNIKGTQNYNQAMGTLNATVGAGNMRMEDLTAALSTGVLPAAKAAGLTLPEVGAALAVLTDRGMGAQMAATRLRMTFAMMQDPTKAATDALDKLGIKQFQLAGLLKSGPDGLLKALELIQAAIDRSKNKTQAYADVLQAFGKGRSSAGILTLLNSLSSSTSSFQGKLSQIERQQNSFARDVAAYHKTAAYQISHAWAAVQATLIKLGAVLAPAATALAKGISAIVMGFSRMPPAFKNTIGVVTVLFATLGPVLFIVGKLGRAFLEAGAIVKSVGVLIRGNAASEVAAEEAVTTAEQAKAAAITETGAASVKAAATVEASATAETAAIDTTAASAGALLVSLQAIAALGVITVTIDMIRRWMKAGDQTDVSNAVANNGPISLGQVRKQAFGKIFGGGGGAANVFYNPDTKKFEAQGAYGTSNGAVTVDKTITKAQAAAALGVSVAQLNNLIKSGSLMGSGASAYSLLNPYQTPDNAAYSLLNPQQKSVYKGVGNVTAAMINRASALTKVSPALISGLITQETGGHWEVNSDSGATGYGQFMPSTGRGMPYNYLTPQGNVNDVGVYIARAIKKYGSVGAAIASYYGGAYGAKVYGTPAGDVRQGTNGKYPSVNEYVQSVLNHAAASGGVITDANNPMASALHNPQDPEAAKRAKQRAAALKKKLAAAKKAADEAAKGIIDPAIETVDNIKTAVEAAIKSGRTPKSIISEFKKDISTYETEISKLQGEYNKGNKEEKSKLEPAIQRLKRGLVTARAGLQKEVNELANDSVKAEAATTQGKYTSFHDDIDKLTRLHQFTVPGRMTNYYGTISKELNGEIDVLDKNIATVTKQLKTAKGPAKTTLQNLLTKLRSDVNDVNNEIESNLEDKVTQMSGLLETAKSTFDSKFGELSSALTSQFEQATQDYIDNVLGPQFAQGTDQFGNQRMTPSEALLAKLQAADSAQSAKEGLDNAQVQYAQDIINGANQATLIQDKLSIKHAQDAIDENNLSIKAGKERAQADHDFAAKEKLYTDQRSVLEAKLTNDLDTLMTGIENGTASMSGLQAILSTYGLSVSGATLSNYAYGISVSAEGGLITATGNLQTAFDALANWINAHTGANPDAGPHDINQPAATITNVGSSVAAQGTLNGRPVYYTDGRWYYADGQIAMLASGGVAMKPTLAMIGEGGEPEAVVPLSKLNTSGDIHIHFDGPVIGSDLRKAAKDLEPHLRSALYRTQRRNVDLKFT